MVDGQWTDRLRDWVLPTQTEPLLLINAGAAEYRNKKNHGLVGQELQWPGGSVLKWVLTAVWCKEGSIQEPGQPQSGMVVYNALLPALAIVESVVLAAYQPGPTPAPCPCSAGGGYYHVTSHVTTQGVGITMSLPAPGWDILYKFYIIYFPALYNTNNATHDNIHGWWEIFTQLVSWWDWQASNLTSVN